MVLWKPNPQDLEVWLDAATRKTVGVGSGTVGGWQDLSGNNRHFYSVGPYPDYVEEAQAGLGGVYFGIEKNFRRDGWDNGMDHVFITVASPPESGDRKYLWHGSSAVAFRNNNELLGYYSGRSWEGTVTPIVGIQLLVWIFDNDAQTCTIRRNGAVVFSGPYDGWTTKGTDNDAGRVEIGGRLAFADWAESTIFELIKLDRLPLIDELERLEGYLAHKWQISNDLDSGHTYKVSAPAGEAAQTSEVSGIVQIDSTPVQRNVRAFGYDPTAHDIDGNTVSQSKSLGHSTSDPETGEYTIDLLGGYADPVFVVAFDDYGADFSPELSVAVGDRVHPTTPNGYVWECTSAGTLPAEEPQWTVDTETAQLYGSASMIAVPFYRPMVHGPVTPEVTETA